ncbi:MAG: hypothetical protein HQL29_00085 [Candidatus Omnitrophica bacterium]|nr:hypothetical protein [Candidatus Omnitrophota bacterium]
MSDADFAGMLAGELKSAAARSDHLIFGICLWGLTRRYIAGDKAVTKQALEGYLIGAIESEDSRAREFASAALTGYFGYEKRRIKVLFAAAPALKEVQQYAFLSKDDPRDRARINEIAGLGNEMIITAK